MSLIALCQTPPLPTSPSLSVSSHCRSSAPLPPLASTTSHRSPNNQRVYIPSHIYTHPAAILLEICTSKQEVYQAIPLIYKHNLYDEHLCQTKLVSLFCKLGFLDDAARVFYPIEDKIEPLYHTMLKGYALNGQLNDALLFFSRMKGDGIDPVVYDFSYLLKVCGESKNPRRGMEIQAQTIVCGFGFDLFVMNGVMSLYAKCREVQDANKMFDRMPKRDVVSWNTMIAGFSQNGNAKVVLELVARMQAEGERPNLVTVVTALPASASLGCLRIGKSIHGFVLRSGLNTFVNVCTALVDMYSKCGVVETARLIFDLMQEKNAVTWNSVIDGYVESEQPEEALELFQSMLEEGIEPSNVTIMAILRACGDTMNMERGRFVHELANRLGFGADIAVNNSLISMYSKCNGIELATRVFEVMQNKTLVSWNAIILGFAQSGHVNKALLYFRKLRLANLRSDSFTLVSIIPALAELSIPRQAKWIHGVCIRSCLDKNEFVMTALVDMYAKCGAVHIARKLFDRMDDRHITTWNAMIDGYGTHGFGESAVELFNEMRRGPIKPNEVTFLCTISACSHSGLVEEGKSIFTAMKEEHGLEPRMDHYGAMVDLLGRAGRLDEAWRFIENMSVEPRINVFGAMLGACKIHKNVELGEKAAKRIFDMNPSDGGYHVLLANIYASTSMWDKVAEVRSKMESTGLRKTPGCSLLELRNEVHTFYSGSTAHPQSKEIYDYLDKLLDKIKGVGYVSEMNLVDDGVEEDVQEQLLAGHSEKLAIAFGLLNTKPGVPIHVRKNLRVCDDCHSATKYISLVTGREIIVRDMHRFHHFKDGVCSCGDYW